MNKWIFRLLAVLLFGPTVYVLHTISGGYPLLTLLLIMAILVPIRLFEKHRLPEDQTFFSWIKQKL